MPQANVNTKVLRHEAKSLHSVLKATPFNQAMIVMSSEVETFDLTPKAGVRIYSSWLSGQMNGIGFGGPCSKLMQVWIVVIFLACPLRLRVFV